MFSPVFHRSTRSTIVVCLAAVFFFVLLPSMAMAQEAYLVTAADGSLSAYNLATNNLIETTKAGLSKNYCHGWSQPAIGIHLGGQLHLGD